MNHPVVGRQWQQRLSAASPILRAATFLFFPVRLMAVSVPQTDWAENPLQLTSTRSHHACCLTAVIHKVLVFVHPPPPPPPKVCSLCPPMRLWVLWGSFWPLCTTVPHPASGTARPPQWSQLVQALWEAISPALDLRPSSSCGACNRWISCPLVPRLRLSHWVV